MKSNNKAFTLIELLAIIVILAIIAVITVPIILNIIDNSRKGAATDSAYGFKDAVNKWYVEELSKDYNFMLKSEYTVQDGKIIDVNDSNDQGVLIPVSGEKPSLGELHYSNNVLKGGCLVIGDYQITFNGNELSTVKGDCSDYEFPTQKPTMADMCPGCVFGLESAKIGLALPSGYDEDYTTHGNYFLGQIVENNVVSRSFVCSKNNNDYICLEGSSDAHENNKYILNQFYPKECFYGSDDAGCWDESGMFGFDLHTYMIDSCDFTEGENCCVININSDSMGISVGESSC